MSRSHDEYSRQSGRLVPGAGTSIHTERPLRSLLPSSSARTFRPSLCIEMGRRVSIGTCIGSYLKAIYLYFKQLKILRLYFLYLFPLLFLLFFPFFFCSFLSFLCYFFRVTVKFYLFADFLYFLFDALILQNLMSLSVWLAEVLNFSIHFHFCFIYLSHSFDSIVSIFSSHFELQSNICFKPLRYPALDDRSAGEAAGVGGHKNGCYIWVFNRPAASPSFPG